MKHVNQCMFIKNQKLHRNSPLDNSKLFQCKLQTELKVPTAIPCDYCFDDATLQQ